MRFQVRQLILYFCIAWRRESDRMSLVILSVSSCSFIFAPLKRLEQPLERGRFCKSVGQGRGGGRFVWELPAALK